MTLGHANRGGFVARLLAAAMLLLGLALAPSMAFAHGDHAHGPAAKPRPVAVAAAVELLRTAEKVVAVVSVTLVEPAQALVRATATGPMQDGGCSDACCSAGISCCVALEACRTSASILEPRAVTLWPGDWRRLAGLAPPGLIRPPARLV